MDDDTEVVMKMVADAFARVKGNRPHVTKADLRRQMKDVVQRIGDTPVGY